MRPCTPLFLRALRSSHIVVAALDVYFPGAAGEVSLPVSGGQLTLDRGSMVRRTGSVTIPWSLRAGEDLGVDLRDLATGGFVVPKRGVRYADGTAELIPLGVLRVEDVAWSETDRLATLQLADRMAQLADEPFLAPYAAAGKRPAQAAVEIVQGVFGATIGYHSLVDPPMTLTDAFYSGSRSDAVSRLAQSFGGAAYFDADGDFVFDGAPGSFQLNLTAVLFNGSPVVTGIPSTAALVPGMNVSGPGVTAGSKILTVDSASGVTLTGPANLSVQKTADGSAGVAQLTVDDTAVLTVGMAVSGVDDHGANPFRAGTLVQSIDSRTVLTLSYPLVTYFTQIDLPLHVQFVSGGNQLLTFTGAVDIASVRPVWAVDAGETGVLVGAAEQVSRAGVYNGVLVNGQVDAAAPPVSALVVVTDPSSELVWGGPFGKVCRIEESAAVQSTAQAQQMGLALLEQAAGLKRTITLTAAPNPALEPADIIDVVFDDGRTERHVIDSISLELGAAGAQTIATRSVYTGVLGLAADPPPGGYGAVLAGARLVTV